MQDLYIHLYTGYVLLFGIYINMQLGVPTNYINSKLKVQAKIN